MHRKLNEDMTPLGLSERRLRYFYEAAQAGSMRAAADRLDVEPSVISRQIQLLEQELGTILLERMGRGVKPTEAALLVLDHYRDRLAGEEALLVRLEELQGLQRGKIHIVAGEGFTEGLMLSALSEFWRQYPKIQITLELVDVEEVVERVAQGPAHLGLAYAPPPNPAVQTIASKNHPICVICRPDHPLTQYPGRLPMREILPYSVGTMLAGFGLRQQIDIVELSERIRFTNGLLTNSIAALKHYAMTGLGVTFLPKLSVVRELTAGDLVALHTDNTTLESTRAHVIVRPKRPLSAATNRLIAHLRGMDLFHSDKTERGDSPNGGA